MNIFDKFLGNELFFRKAELSVVETFVSFLFSKKIKKGECILKEGDINNKIFYIQSGFFRVFKTDEGKEVNTWFVKEGDFIMSVNSFHKEIPSIETIEALEDGEVLSIRKELYYKLIKSNHKLALFAINELMQNLCEYQTQCNFLRHMSAEDRYLYLTKTHSNILDRISQKHLASFLGVEITYLNKIIKNLEL